ncbi:MAG: HNH endonuclease [Gammaproteobacteria bacterium]|nr:HNH endonuclease [Gammaproteobacteria bacterium]
MTIGIEVVWRDDNGHDEEIEYFSGIDVHHLDAIPRFESVPAVWPRYEGGTSVEYKVRAHAEPGPNNEVHLIVKYKAADNPEIARTFNPWWGTNRIILTHGGREGRCHWRRSDGRERTIPWRSFDLAAAQGRPRATYLRSRRYGQFRRIILAADGHRCVLTGESTPAALEAAHLIPAKLGENDKPFNGIALRADLHRLFDAGLFTFAKDGEVVLADQDIGTSGDYRSLLRDNRLPDDTLHRVRDTLALSAFKNRQ